MKKAIFIIMFALPLFLMITISIAGRLIIMYVPTPVESIHFENSDGDKITMIEVGKDKTVKIVAVVLPELASNKKVIYTKDTSKTNPIYDFDEETGIITGKIYGAARLIAVTDDKNFQAEIEINVTDKNVSSITIDKESLSLKIGEKAHLIPIIEPKTAVNRNVTWKSSNPDLVRVSLGEVVALAVTPEDEPVSVTVTTEDGGFVAECLVVVSDGLPAMAFYRIGEELPIVSGEIPVRTTEINFADYLRIDENLIDFGEITFTRLAGNGVISGQTATFVANKDYVKVLATVTREGKIIYSCEASFRYWR